MDDPVIVFFRAEREDRDLAQAIAEHDPAYESFAHFLRVWMREGIEATESPKPTRRKK